MKKSLVRMLSPLVAAALLAGLLGVSASAAEDYGEVTIEKEESVITISSALAQNSFTYSVPADNITITIVPSGDQLCSVIGLKYIYTDGGYYYTETAASYLMTSSGLLEENFAISSMFLDSQEPYRLTAGERYTISLDASLYDEISLDFGRLYDSGVESLATLKVQHEAGTQDTTPADAGQGTDTVDNTSDQPDESQGTAVSIDQFTDLVDGAYYTEAVKWAVANGYALGTSDTTFEPDRTCSIAEILTFMWRANGKMGAAIAIPYSDVSWDDYYADAVLWAAESRILYYTDTPMDGTLGGERPCTRAMTVEFFWRLANSPVVESTASFNDVSASSSYAQAVAWAVSTGLTEGTGDGNFSPDVTCTRAQILTFLYRALEA